ncbi:MAG: (d)CMP kinase [Ignavibacteria bacterium]|nr:(d)CMP kinase [Ignavibacteria bacterium]
MKRISIAIDGPAASGKSTTAKQVAAELGYVHIDTGAMYRAITLKVINRGIPVDDAEQVCRLAEETHVRLARDDGSLTVYLDDRDVTREIRSKKVTQHVSTVSSYPGVRTVMVREQRTMAEGGGVVLEGRDIGTVVLPDAQLKIFLVANIAERARRRRSELEASGIATDEGTLISELVERDRKDESRENSPLRRAPDAIELDTTNLSVTEQVDFIVKRARSIIEGKVGHERHG